jgi:hypothetical protein
MNMGWSNLRFWTLLCGVVLLTTRTEAAITSEIEPNDTRAQATAITSPASFLSAEIPAAGIQVGGALVPSDVDWYAVGVQAGERLMVSVSEADGGRHHDALLDVFDPTGALVASNDDGGPRRLPQIQVVATASGDWTVRVRGFAEEAAAPDLHEEEFDYRLVLAVATDPPRFAESDPGAPLPGNNDTTATADPIPTASGVGATSSGVVVASGALTPGDVDVYSVDVTAGELLVVSVFEPGSGEFHDPVVRILDSDGNPVASSDDDGLGLLSAAVSGVTVDDRWSIVVEGFDFEQDGSEHIEDFDYELVVSSPGIGLRIDENLAPVVTIAAVPVVLPGAAGANLEATVVDDGQPGPLAYRWCKVPRMTASVAPPGEVPPPGTGPGSVVFANPDSPHTEAFFDIAGNYELSLRVDDGQRVTVETTPVTVAPLAAGLPPAHGPMLTGRGEATLFDRDASEAYYATIDPLGLRTTLEDWATLNGIDFASLSGVRKAALGPDLEGCCAVIPYFNSEDLGFGRRLVMARNGDQLALVTTNHHNIADAMDGVRRINAVTMEISPRPSGGEPFSKFFVYVHDPTTGRDERVPYIDLDGTGIKGVPGVCASCHGGKPMGPNSNGVYADDGDFKASAMPLVVADMEFACEQGFERADLEPIIKQVNRLLHSTSSEGEGGRLIEALYGGPGLPRATQLDDYVPDDWAGHPEFYLDVLAPSCRSCHLNIEDELLSFAGFVEQISDIREEVFDHRSMPHALLPYRRFWLSTRPHRPAVLAAKLTEIEYAPEPSIGSMLIFGVLGVAGLATRKRTSGQGPRA